MDARGLLEVAAEFAQLTANKDYSDLYGGNSGPRLEELAAQWEAGLAEYVARQKQSA